MHAWLQRFWFDDRGATAVEYALMASLLAVLMFAAVRVLGDELSNLFTDLANRF